METLGKLVRCDRCHDVIFLERDGRIDWNDMDEFEDLPKTWMYDERFGHLCPLCTKEFKTFVNGFFPHLCAAWAFNEEETNDL